MSEQKTHPATQSPALRTFDLPKGRVQAILLGILGLQETQELSGKFARKVGRNRRRLTTADETFVAESREVQGRYTRRDAEGNPLPLIQTNAGQPIFMKDADGKDTDEVAIVPNGIVVTDQKAYDAELDELKKETLVFECEAFTTEELDLFKKIRGSIVDAMQDLSEDESEFIRPLAIAEPAPEEREAP